MTDTTYEPTTVTLPRPAMIQADGEYKATIRTAEDLHHILRLARCWADDGREVTLRYVSDERAAEVDQMIAERTARYYEPAKKAEATAKKRLSLTTGNGSNWWSAYDRHMMAVKASCNANSKTFAFAVFA